VAATVNVYAFPFTNPYTETGLLVFPGKHIVIPVLLNNEYVNGNPYPHDVENATFAKVFALPVLIIEYDTFPMIGGFGNDGGGLKFNSPHPSETEPDI
jgi:hypothetical protein